MGENGQLEDISDKGKVIAIRRWAVAAAVLLLAAGAGWWYMTGKTAAVQYATVAGEERTVALPDGSTVVLSGQARIGVDGNYDKTNRTVTLVEGKALFNVSHQEQRPFTVDMDAVSIKDIGTSFTVEKTKDSIKVMVSEGKIAFIKKETGESREISAGGSLCFYTVEHRFGAIRSSDSTDALRFDNAPLSEVITALQKTSGKKILLSDTALAQKRLTVHLAGESFEDALKTVCASLNLKYTVEGDVYVLK